MKMRTISTLTASLALILAGSLSTAASAHPAGPEIDCKLDYSITGWSAIYKHSEGSGLVHCDNGQTMKVKITAKGVGLTAGKWRIDDGNGRFSDVHDIAEVLGKYAHGEAHAGVVKSVSTQVVTKGNISLALAGHGEGVDLGVDIGQLVISRGR
jgi:hypothetical protein